MKQENIIGERLRKLRNAHKLTQEEMSARFFLTRSCIANYERGVRRPSLELLQHIADYFQVDVNYLLGKTDEITPLNISSELILTARFLTKDEKLDISFLSALHKIMAIEYINYLRIREQTEILLDEENA